MKTRFQILVQGVLSKYFAMATWIICGVILTPLLLSHLGAEAYGLYAAVGSLVAYLYVIDMGTGYAVPKFVAEYTAKRDTEALSKLASSFFFAFLGLSTLLIIAGAAFLPYVPAVFKTSPGFVHVAQAVFFITALNVAIFLPLGGVMGGLLYGSQKVHIDAGLDALFYILNLLGAYVALKLGFGLVAVTLGTLAARIIVSLLAVWFVRIHCPAIRLRLENFDWKLLKRMFSPSFYYFVIQIATLLIMSTDNIVISSFLGVSAVTAYAIAFKLCKLPVGIISSVAGVLLPHISEMEAARNLSRLRAVHIQLTKYSMLLALVVFTCLAAFGERLISIWVGPEHFVGTAVLLCFCLLWPLNTIVQCSSMVLMGMAQHKKLAWALGVEGLANLALSILLLRYWGVLGVALGTVISKLLVSFWFAPWYACRKLDQDFGDYVKDVAPVLLPILPTAGLVAALRFLNVGPVLLVVGGSLAIGITYFTIFYWLSLRHEEREFLWTRMAALWERSTLAA